MDWKSLIEMCTALIIVLGVHLKNRSQDATVKKLQDNLADVDGRLVHCEEDRKKLRELIEDKLNG